MRLFQTHQNETRQRTRILEVLFSFRVGGSEMLGLQLAKQLKEYGADVLCGALDEAPGPMLARCAEYGIPVIELGIPTRSVLGRNGFSMAVARRLRDLHLDAIHVQHFLGLNKLGIPARIAGIDRLVVTEHSVFDVSQSVAGRIRTRFGWRMADAITVVHRSIKDYLCDELGVASGRVEVIPIGIEIDRYNREDRAARRAALGLSDETTFIFVGRLAPVKNVPGLVSAYLAAVSDHGGRSRLIVVGDGQDRAACESLTGSHRHGHCVSFVGEQMDTRSYVAAADVFILNSRSEGTPRALLEAMAAGLPAICPAVGGIPDILEGRGWLSVPDDQSSLEQRIRAVLANPSAIASMGARCREYVRRNFDAEKIGRRYEKLLMG